MPIDDYAFRPITFQGATFPPTLMGISMLGPILGIADKDIDDWLWRFPICCGISKREAADRCARCAEQLSDLMLEQRQRVLDGIRGRLAPHGFDPDATYRDWLTALQRIKELSEAADEECTWSAPEHSRDSLKSEADVRRLIEGIMRYKPGDK